MASNKTRGALQVTSPEFSLFELNDVLRRIREELDELQGLRGRAEIFDKLKVATAPTADDDAVRRGDTIIILGTGISVFAVGDIFYASATDVLTLLNIGAANTLLASTGTAPSWTAAIAPTTVQIGGGATVTKILTATAALNFPNTLAQTSSDLTIAVTGAADANVVLLGVPSAAVEANSSYSAWVDSAGSVTVRFSNYSAGALNPASGTFRVVVVQF